MSEVLTKQAQNKIGRYFLRFEDHLTKPGFRCIREMTTGKLKSVTVLVNQKAPGYLPIRYRRARAPSVFGAITTKRVFLLEQIHRQMTDS